MGVDNDFVLSVAPYAAEFFGTFILVMTAEWTILTGAEVTWAVTAVAAVLIALVYSCGPISGANFNPAVTLAQGLSGLRPWNQVFGYWLVQLSAGVLAGVFCNMLLYRVVARGLKAMLFDAYPLYYAGGAEAFYTCVLAFVVLCVHPFQWPDEGSRYATNTMYYGLATGMVIIAGGYAAGGISGACFNPAVIIGFDLTLWDPVNSFTHAGFYSLCQMGGGAVAAILYKVIYRPGEDDTQLSRLLGEFFGTFVVAFTVGLNIVTRSKVMPWSAMGAYMSMSYALYRIAGSFNPAVTLGVIMSGPWKNHWLQNWEPATHIMSIFTQFGAGALGGLISGWYCLAREDVPRWIQVEIGKFATALEYPLFTALWAEFLFTAVLTFVFLAVWSKAPLDEPTPTYWALAISMCITAGGFAAGPVSGGILNPAVAVGISTEGYVNANQGFGHLDRNWTSTLFYWILAEFFGGVMGSVVYRIVYRETYIQRPVVQAIKETFTDTGSKNQRSCSGFTVWNTKNTH